MNTDKNDEISSRGFELATLGGGCFWCLEPAFRELQGVIDVVVGYAGGDTDNPDYHQVCTGMTGHAEVVQVAFNPQQVTFRELLEVFFSLHDPTTRNRQGADVGTQYRSIILYHDEQQKETAQQVMSQLTQNGVWGKPLVTQLEPLQMFYRAEDYHQGYFAKNPNQGYCRVVIAPKLSSFRSKFALRLK